MVRKSPRVILFPGEWYFGNRSERIETLLGSCVAVTLWSAIARVGGMCHIILPGENLQQDCIDAKYATCVIGHFVRRLKSERLSPTIFEVGIYGGGIALENSLGKDDHIGAKNVEMTEELLSYAGFTVGKRDVGGYYYRRLYMDLGNGQVRMERVSMSRQSRAV